MFLNDRINACENRGYEIAPVLNIDLILIWCTLFNEMIDSF